MRSIKTKTIQGYNVDRLVSFIDRAMLSEKEPAWRVNRSYGIIYKFDPDHSAFLYYVPIADYAINKIREIAHIVNLGLIAKESIALARNREVGKFQGFIKREADKRSKYLDSPALCVVCGSRIAYPTALHGHNPWPLHDKGFACRPCNQTVVIPKRLKSL